MEVAVKLLRMLRLVFSPFKEIARELRIIRELYEEELGSMQPPVMRRTETPDPRFDTEIFDGSEARPGWKKFLAFEKPEEEPFDE